MWAEASVASLPGHRTLSASEAFAYAALSCAVDQQLHWKIVADALQSNGHNGNTPMFQLSMSNGDCQQPVTSCFMSPYERDAVSKYFTPRDSEAESSTPASACFECDQEADDIATHGDSETESSTSASVCFECDHEAGDSWKLADMFGMWRGANLPRASWQS